MNKRRTRIPRRIRRLTIPLIALATLAAAFLSVACGDDAQPAESEQLARVEQSTAQTEQQQSMEQQQQAMEEQAQQAQQQVSYAAAEQQQAVHEFEQQAEQAEQAEHQAVQQEAEQQLSADSSRSRSRQEQQRSSRQQQPRRALPGATNFEDYATTGWRDTATDDTATFSLDVDRTSYFLALNWVQNGYLIEPASVRAEEWINAFNYRYDRPDVDDSFAITTDLVEHPLHSDLHLVRIATQAPEFVDDTPLNVTLVLDSSGSMSDGDRVEIARAAAESIRRGLSDDDRIAVVLFSTAVVDYERHQRPDHRGIDRVISNLRPRNSTNVRAGLNLAVQYADDIRRERPDSHNYVILMSDGVANVDATDPFAILRTAEDRDESNPLRLITVGVGIENYNDVLLEQLAQYGNGWYRYLSDIDEARSTFNRDNWLALSIPFADQARAQVRWDEDAVLAWRQVGYENRVTSDRNFEQDRKEFAEVPIGTATTMFFEVELTADALRDSFVELGEVELRWLTPRSDESNRQQVDLGSRIHRFGDDEMLDLGTVVALAADRYSWIGQDGLSRETIALAADNLDEIAGWFNELPNSILDTQAGRDFAQLLQAMGAVAEDHESEDPGYSR
ncbi:MAG: von Willebrand factor type A domain-containing protein [Chloroflexi bacterium]|nr:von Willebrand factor type A domain-containing protein [Chloroflexota bacterium]